MARRNPAGSGSIAALVVGLLALILALAVYLVWAGGERGGRIALNLPGPSQSLPSPDRQPDPQPLPTPLPRRAG